MAAEGEENVLPSTSTSSNIDLQVFPLPWNSSPDLFISCFLCRACFWIHGHVFICNFIRLNQDNGDNAEGKGIEEQYNRNCRASCIAGGVVSFLVWGNFLMFMDLSSTSSRQEHRGNGNTQLRSYRPPQTAVSTPQKRDPQQVFKRARKCNKWAQQTRIKEKTMGEMDYVVK